ncbi:Pre-mRNA-splicing factor SF3A3 of SF3a complex Prp9 [Gracilaria domingensis]|nr:Pre-mRNA-splicing factor SF3A3 of SF3a complex Prp9 [Gracilaria domingensis]
MHRQRRGADHAAAAMSTSDLDNVRQLHEDIETLKHLAAAALQSRAEPSAPHPRISAVEPPFRSTRDVEQLVADLTQLASSKAAALCDIYQRPFAGAPRDALSSFYAQLRDLRDAHRARAVVPELSRDAALLMAAYRPPSFSGEECDGRYLDLLQHFHTFLNLNKSAKHHVQSVEYYQYVRDDVTTFSSLPPAIRTSRPYEAYLQALCAYLKDFARRAHPLDATDAHLATVHDEARKKIVTSLSDIAANYPTYEQLLEHLSPQNLRDRLLQFGLKCGGRPQDRAKRLLNAAREAKFGRAAVLEQVVSFALDKLLAPERGATVANIQKRLALSYPEIEAERRAMEALADGVEVEQVEQMETTVYNPKDLPLGWDGKPIPYWMYKLHGLNHEFRCEICGNATYKAQGLLSATSQTLNMFRACDGWVLATQRRT